MSDIGYQDGIQAFENWFRKLSVAIDAQNRWVQDWKAWVALPVDIQAKVDPPTPPTFPKIPLEGPNFNRNDMTTWPWPAKFFDNTMRKLKDDHDASNPTNGGGGNPPPPTYLKVAPITVREEGGSDQMVCLWASPGVLHPGVRRLSSGEYTDDSGAKYAADGDGRENSAVRSKVHDSALVGARSMDGRSACECPAVGDPTKNTGSWTI